MNTFCFYDLDTGFFTEFRRTNRRKEEVPVPAGCAIREGAYDHLSQKIDRLTDQIVDFQPPAPDDDHEWIHDDEEGNRVRRWTLKPDAAERATKRAAAQARMAVLAGKVERASREFLLGIEPTVEDRAAGALTLQEIEDEMAALRTEVR